MTDDRGQKDREVEQFLRIKLAYFFQGHADAIEFFMAFWRITQVWDDLVDGDNERTANDINDAFRLALVELPGNPFYLRNQHVLVPLILNVILQWQDSNVLECGPDHEKHMAFMLRAGLYQLVNVCAYLIGGAEWAGKKGPDMRRMYGETLESFMEETKCRIQLRD